MSNLGQDFSSYTAAVRQALARGATGALPLKISETHCSGKQHALFFLHVSRQNNAR
jgi:hypothetical protein